MKFLILLPYFNRPRLVKFAINSVLSQEYQNWEMVICDDGSDTHIQDVLNEMNIDDERITIKRLEDTIEFKELHGSRSGMMLNESMSQSDADVVITLCDDDGLYPDCLSNLAEYYNTCDAMYSYGYISAYDPVLAIESSDLPATNLQVSLNHGVAVQPVCSVDASQVSWRLNNDTKNIYPYPQTAALDAVVFQRLFDLYGLCVYNNITVQYKGFFSDQLGGRMSAGMGINPIIS